MKKTEEKKSKQEHVAAKQAKKVDKGVKTVDNNDNKGIVTFDVRRKKWKACKPDATGKVDYVGHFETEKEAYDACK